MGVRKRRTKEIDIWIIQRREAFQISKYDRLTKKFNYFTAEITIKLPIYYIISLHTIFEQKDKPKRQNRYLLKERNRYF